MTDDDFALIEQAAARVTNDFGTMSALLYTQPEYVQWMTDNGDPDMAQRLEAVPPFRTVGDHDGALTVLHGAGFVRRTPLRRGIEKQ